MIPTSDPEDLDVLISLLLCGGALAQDGSVASLTPMLTELGAIVQTIETDGYQITEMTIGRVFAGADASVPVYIQQDDPVLFVGLGDRERIVDLDLAVMDDLGTMVAKDDLPDPNPVVSFQAPRSGQYRARVRVAQTAGDFTGGFYLLVTAYPTGGAPISVGATFRMLDKAVELMQLDGYQVLHGEWETIAAGDSAAVLVDLPEGASCRAVAVGSPDRLRRINLFVLDPYNNLVMQERSREELAIGDFVTTQSGDWMLVMEARKLRRKVPDTHAAVTVACR